MIKLGVHNAHIIGYNLYMGRVRSAGNVTVITRNLRRNLRKVKMKITRNLRMRSEFSSIIVYMEIIDDVMEQDNMTYSVSFLKKHTDGSYYWPEYYLR